MDDKARYYNVYKHTNMFAGTGQSGRHFLPVWREGQPKMLKSKVMKGNKPIVLIIFTKIMANGMQRDELLGQ